MTPEERKLKVAELRREHKDLGTDVLYIPKMAYRPSGKDELYVSFFPSELQKGKDIYTEFVSIDYDSEDPKRTLYMWKHTPHWDEEYELITSSSGFERHIIPVGELKVISDVNSRNKKTVSKIVSNFEELPDPDSVTEDSNLIQKLDKIANSLDRIAEILTINNLK